MLLSSLNLNSVRIYIFNIYFFTEYFYLYSTIEMHFQYLLQFLSLVINVLIFKRFFFEKLNEKGIFFFINKERNEYFYLLRNENLEHVFILLHERGIARFSFKKNLPNTDFSHKINQPLGPNQNYVNKLLNKLFQ